MRISLIGLVRLTLMLGLGLTLAAIGLGRLESGGWTDEAPGLRRPATPLTFVLSTPEMDTLARLLDPTDGTLRGVPLPDRERMDQLTCAPWQDARGRRPLVGRWSAVEGRGSDRVGSDFGIGLFRYPDGALLQKVPSEIYPIAPPCWVSGSSSRIVFAAGDGRLYHFDFDALRDASGLLSRAPEPITWDDDPGVVRLADPHWPAFPEFRDRLLVSVQTRETYPEAPSRISRSQLRWIRLDASGRRIIESGRVTTPARDGAEETGEYRPVVSRSPDGQPLLLYQTHNDEGRVWRHCIARLAFDPKTGAPTASPPVELGGSDYPAVLAISAAGDAVYSIVGGWASLPKVRRLAIPADF